MVWNCHVFIFIYVDVDFKMKNTLIGELPKIPSDKGASVVISASVCVWGIPQGNFEIPDKKYIAHTLKDAVLCKGGSFESFHIWEFRFDIS